MSVVLDAPAAFRSSAVRPAPLGLLREAWREVVSRRRLIRYLVVADLRKKGTDTFLGNLWWVIDPLLQMLVYVILVSFVFQRGHADYPLFILAALLPWKWFTSSVNDAIGSVTSQDRLIRQVQFPKIVLPLAAVGSGIASFAFGLITLFVMLFVLYPYRASALILFLPAIAVVQLVFTIGVALLVAATNVFFRDVSNVARHTLRLWWYLSPGLYSAAQINELAGEHHTIAQLIYLNPFVVIFESYRGIVYEGVPPNWSGLGIILGVSLVLLLLAVLVFKRLEPRFAKVL